jgi:predicted Zn-ribbon and HTH transcriptional regulator
VSRLSWLKRVNENVRRCPACGQSDWHGPDFGAEAVLVSPSSPRDHPELPGGVDGLRVLPLVCRRCGFVANFSVDALRSAPPW